MNKFFRWMKDYFGSSNMKRENERRNITDKTVPRLGVVVGHSKEDKGAESKSIIGLNEYDYNSIIAHKCATIAPHIGIDVQVYFRDDIGISGAYSNAIKDNCDAIIELHCNAHNGLADGCLTLTSPKKDDQAFAKVIHSVMKSISKGKDRGVRVLARGDRGSLSCYSAGDIPNCLLEPFFIDNSSEAFFWNNQKERYASEICAKFKEWCEINGMRV